MDVKSIRCTVEADVLTIDWKRVFELNRGHITNAGYESKNLKAMSNHGGRI